MAVSTTTVLDVPTLVSQLMALERKPITTLQDKVTANDSRISTFGTIKSLVATFQSSVATLTSSLGKYSATASDSTVFSATASSSAVAGSYTLTVAHLARAQSLVAEGQSSSTTPITGATPSTVSIVVGTTTTDVAVGAGATLEDIRNAINTANAGVSATIVNDGSGTPYRLALTANSTGTANAVSSITVAGDDALNTLLAFNPTSNPPPLATLAEPVTALDASFSVNGINVTSSTNTISDAIQGVTLNLKNSTTGATLTVARDSTSMVDAAGKFVDAYNAMVKQMKSSSAFATSSKTTAPPLSGDGTVRMMLDQMRSILSTAAGESTYSYLAEVGISQQSDGTLKLDSSTFSSALNSKFSDVESLFNGATGFATRFDAWTSSALNTDGLIATRVGTLNETSKSYNDAIDKLELRMTQLERQYTITYTNLNTYLASMDSLSTYLTSQTDTWFKSSK